MNGDPTMFSPIDRRTWLLSTARLAALGWLGLETASGRGGRASASQEGGRAASPGAGATVRNGDRIAWIGSSSTKIGVWPRTVEFLLRTRHPGLELHFQSCTSGGGTFDTCLENLDGWLDEFRPTLVFLNFGANDAAQGPEGLLWFKDRMRRCVSKVRDRDARVILITPQAADPKKTKRDHAAWRTLYAETILSYGRSRGWDVIDIHHPLAMLQETTRRVDPGYSILRDSIHLTDPAYVAWGFFLFDRLDLPFVRSWASLTAAGRVKAAENCDIQEVELGQGSLSFTRIDRVLPILPPGPLPPRLGVPMEAHSCYVLKVAGLAQGEYEILCESQPIGVAKASDLGIGVNLNSLLLDAGRKAPWAALAQSIWEGNASGQIGQTRWRYEVRKR